MKTKTLLSILLAIVSTSGFAVTWTVANSANTFTPATISINLGDDVNFNIANAHDAREVSEATWNTSGTTALSGGFQTPFGGGLVSASQLGVGTHYYVCTPHASLGMLGRIIVQNLTTGIASLNSTVKISLFPNPATNFISFDTGSNAVGSTSYTITNAEGSEVMSGKLNEQISTVDISHLAAGLYLTELYGQTNSSLKFVKL